jgi:hypothetical protein
LAPPEKLWPPLDELPAPLLLELLAPLLELLPDAVGAGEELPPPQAVSTMAARGTIQRKLRIMRVCVLLDD